MYYRTIGDETFKFYGNYVDWKHIWNEWGEGAGNDRDNEPAWIKRYEYEEKLITPIIQANNFKDILELGAGTGKLSQLILHNNQGINYTLIDKPNGKKTFDERGYVGDFIISDLNIVFDTSIFNENKFDFIIANDFLEHIQNPSSVLHGVYNILNNSGKFFVSVPNWRMGHEFIYRGLFDFDNFIYFASIHGFKLEGMYRSELKCNSLPKLDSEKYLPDIMLNCWNWYLLFNKIFE